MSVLLTIYLAICAITFVAAPTLGGGWFWDADNALGFAAFAGILYLSVPLGGRRDVRQHELLSRAVLAIALIHAFWFLFVDAAAVEFIKPGAPPYMWAGIIALVFLAASIGVSAMPTRKRVHKNHTSFKMWHRATAIVAIGAAAYHVVATGFYLQTWYQALAFILLCGVVVGSLMLKLTRPSAAPASITWFLAMSVLGAVVFATVRNLPS